MIINDATTTVTIQEINKTFKTKNEEIKNEEVNKKTSSRKQEVPQDTYEKSGDTSKQGLYSDIKKLSSTQIQAIKDNEQATQIQMLEQMMNANIKNQNIAYSLVQQTEDLWTKVFGSIDAALPPLATNKEEAQKALEAGGTYSVGAVAERIMTMAEALAGDDSSKIVLLRQAVEKGFKQAGIEIKSRTKSELPKICQDTYDEVMKRFDVWEEKEKNVVIEETKVDKA
ncbi:hypothetical protein CS063_12975 [Sporanaerobium hydrogeniformans]|uniref:Uncharacterized protein n=1 Tax=Sporanaerobium hydrogeniformans TaxID=3072179 RepID=A0AC61DAV7_9FIRM|nr:hypothetical protein [Sporanaerobium hydrogeniformans]PHV69893.1 hypothetical protein CS063_12975 [Sporanaerobium hydrogeniformans]